MYIMLTAMAIFCLKIIFSSRFHKKPALYLQQKGINTSIQFIYPLLKWNLMRLFVEFN